MTLVLSRRKLGDLKNSDGTYSSMTREIFQLLSKRDYHSLFIESSLSIRCRQFRRRLPSKLEKRGTVRNRASNMGAPYNRPIIPGSIYNEKRRDALTSAGQLGIMRRKLYVMP